MDSIVETFNRLSREDKESWKYPWLKEVCQLCLEYLMLDGLEDALRASEIPDEILEICKEVTCNEA